jgi:tetratricopeptide (TPR) repeat protein
MIGSRNSLGTNCVGTGPAAPIKSRFTLVLLLACALAGALSAQEAPNLEEKPRSNLVIRVEGATRDWEVMPVALMYRSGGKGTIANSQGLLKLDREKWPSTGAPKRYKLDDWRKLFQEFTGADERAKAANFEFQARNPRAPNLQGVVTEKTAGRTTVYVVPADKVKIIGYPQTWINIYEDYVNKVQGPERRVAVKMWEEAFRSTIENPEQVATGFSTEERNEFAQFYQRQFEFIRNENPQDPAIYQELADYHRTRGNLDAELSIYLDGIANGVPSPKLEEFALSVGRIFVTRLALYPEAIAYLDMASAYAEARYLKARCQIEMGQTVAARATLRDLLAALAQGGETALVTTLSAEDENGRANLMLARVEFDEVQFKPAEATIKLIPAASQSYQEGQVLLAAMLTQRGLRDDHQKVKEVLDPLKVVLDGKKLKPEDPNAIIPFDPLMSQALVLYAQTDAQFRQAIDPKAKPQTPNATILTLLNVAKATDPLSGEPYLAEGRLKQRLGDFVGALEAYNAGLVIEPNSVRLSYSVASLKNKAGALDEAKDLCSRCLRQDARFIRHW